MKKTMLDYTTYCTPEQAKRAHKLGMPVAQTNAAYCYLNTPVVQIGETRGEYGQKVGVYYVCPTTQQMIGWLIEKGFLFTISMESEDAKYTVAYQRKEGRYPIVYKTSELTAIGAALDYLEKGNQL